MKGAYTEEGADLQQINAIFYGLLESFWKSQTVSVITASEFIYVYANRKFICS